MIIFKFFALGEYEKKEKWVNKMCSKGYALTNCNVCSFMFDKCNPGEYYYSIELNMYANIETGHFLEEKEN